MADTNLASILLVLLGSLSQISQRRLTRTPNLESTPPLTVPTRGIFIFIKIIRDLYININ